MYVVHCTLHEAREAAGSIWGAIVYNIRHDPRALKKCCTKRMLTLTVTRPER